MFVLPVSITEEGPRTETTFCILLKFYAIVKLINVYLSAFNVHPCSTYTFDTTRTTLKFYYYIICACLCYILSTYSDPVPTRGVQSNITLEDSGDILESRASSAVTMCPSPHTPGPAGKETPVVRTHPFNFHSPVPSTPEP